MYNFLKIQYQLGAVTEKQLRGFIDIWITKEEYMDIINQKG